MIRGASSFPVARAAGRLFYAVAAISMVSAALLLSAAPAAKAETSATGASAQQPMRVWSPEILNGVDRELYRKLFVAMERGRFAEADRLTAQIRD